MKTRWNPVINDINLLLKALRKLISEPIDRVKRGRKPKHDLREYLKLIVAKEARKCNLRVGHSVIHYWEKSLTLA